MSWFDGVANDIAKTEKCVMKDDCICRVKYIYKVGGAVAIWFLLSWTGVVVGTERTCLHMYLLHFHVLIYIVRFFFFLLLL